jgi:hypothetical protein
MDALFIARREEFHGCVCCIIFMSIVKDKHNIGRLGIVCADISLILRKPNFEKMYVQRPFLVPNFQPVKYNSHPGNLFHSHPFLYYRPIYA